MVCCVVYSIDYDDLTVWLQLYRFSTLHQCMIVVAMPQLEQTRLFTAVRLHCTMLHSELMCVVLYINNVRRRDNWRQNYHSKRIYKRKSVPMTGFHLYQVRFDLRCSCQHYTGTRISS